MIFAAIIICVMLNETEPSTLAPTSENLSPVLNIIKPITNNETIVAGKLYKSALPLENKKTERRLLIIATTAADLKSIVIIHDKTAIFAIPSFKPGIGNGRKINLSK